jgi:HEAT repeat protein
MGHDDKEPEISPEQRMKESPLNLDSEPVTSSRFTDEAFQQKLVDTDTLGFPEQWLRLLNHSSWKVRVQAVQALQRSTETRVIQALIRCLSDEATAVRIAAIQVLGALGELVPMKELLTCLQDEEASVRIAAIQVLGALGKRVPVEYLLPTLTDLDWTVRETAVLTLGKRVPDKVYAALYDEESFVREAALFVLQGRLPIKQLVHDLKYGDLKMRVGLASIMGEFKELATFPELLKALIYVLQHENESNVRKEAILSLGRLDISVPVEPLQAARSDSDQGVRVAAEIVLDAKGIQLLSDSDAGFIEADMDAPAALWPSMQETETNNDVQIGKEAHRMDAGGQKEATNYVGQRFGNYILSGKIAEGSRAIVYLGKHIYLKTQVAIKMLNVHLPAKALEGFLQEAQMVAQLKHPAIVRVLDFGVERDIPFLVMDYAPHGNLRQRYPRGERVALPIIVSYVKQIAGALQYAHNNGVIHRDVKPENILLNSDDALLLSDFGIAQLERNLANPYQHRDKVSGTLSYMAPEQWRGEPCAASDQYSLAVVAYELLCGTPPFQGSTLNTIMNEHLRVAPPALRQYIPDLSSQVEAVVLAALAKKPEQRFKSIQLFANALGQATSPEVPSDARPTKKSRLRFFRPLKHPKQ